MARRKGPRRGGRGGGAGGGQRQNYGTVEKTNKGFEFYYNELGIVPMSEREEFWNATRRELPLSFRFTASRGHALTVQQRLIDHYVPTLAKLEFAGESVEPPKAVEWFPRKLAWSMLTPKNTVRKYKEFKDFQQYLVYETEVGNISRQEIVSMIPPLLLDVRPGHVVLETCAAPGSKSTQIIELLHAGEEARVRKFFTDKSAELKRGTSPNGVDEELEEEDLKAGDDWSDDGRATGLLIANDVDAKRAQTLVRQTKRLGSPNVIFTAHDASFFPSIRLPSNGTADQYLKFDRILADVPCTGDGTSRKNYTVWQDWSPAKALGLHPLQLRILVRALQMLKVGGKVVYSTCSLNPVENEAVVASAVEQCGGASKVRLIDCSNALPGLKRRPGLTFWKVIDKGNSLWSSWNELESAEGSGLETDKIRPTMFAPKTVDDSSRVPLENCVRIYPHLQDTGGFFIAVLEKLDHVIVPTNAPKRARDEAPDETEQDAKRTKTQHSAPYTVASTASNDVHDLMNGVVTELGAGTGAHVETADDAAAEASVKTEAASDDDVVSRPGSGLELRALVPKKDKSAPQEEHFIYLDPENEEIDRVYEFYELSNRFPRDRFMVRNAAGEPVKLIYYTSALVRDILVENRGRGIKYLHCGVKMFQKQDVQGHSEVCKWRIQSEGLPIIERWVGEARIVRVYKQATLHALLKHLFPKIDQPGGGSLFEEIRERLDNLTMGCAVVRTEVSNDPEGFKERMVFGLWRGVASVNVMLQKMDRLAALLRLFGDHGPLVDHSKQITHTGTGDDAGLEAEDDASNKREDETTAVVGPSTAIQEQSDGINARNGAMGADEANHVSADPGADLESTTLQDPGRKTGAEQR